MTVLCGAMLLAGYQVGAYLNPFPNDLCYRDREDGSREFFNCELVWPIINDLKDYEIGYIAPPPSSTQPTLCVQENVVCPDCVCTTCPICLDCAPYVSTQQSDCINSLRPDKEAVCYQDGFYKMRRLIRTCLDLNNTKFWEGPTKPNARHPLIVNPEEYRNNTIVYRD